ncbi:unnamed protein product [Litomosoides sigmodontis]|uniref:Uncharacterized protein n=1 Tax=Litomosoides sigmodontis TaxID=42156 RepID=A0A3P6SEG3_LITSI|nr:unnamed protein product [Litomosoides sigmodontis]
MERITTKQLSMIPNHTTVAPPLRLFNLPLFTLPPAPYIDTYGINTIPELPPQHESIYEGMFAPDGSLIKNTARKAANGKNPIRDGDRLGANDESLRHSRVTGIRAADGPIIDDEFNNDSGNSVDDDDDENDDNIHPDYKYISNYGKNMIMANLLDKQAPHSKSNAKKLSAEAINSDKITTLPKPKNFTPDNAATIVSTTETVKSNVKSSTLTRLQVLVSNENDELAEKNFSFVTSAEGEKLHRIFPRSEQSSIEVTPTRAPKRTSDNATITELPMWRDFKNESLDRTTIQPNLHFVVRDRGIECNENNLNAHIQPAAQSTLITTPTSQFYNWNDQLQRQYHEHSSQYQLQQPLLQHQPEQYHQLQRYQPQQQPLQYQQQFHQYRFLQPPPTRDPEDEAYLREIEEYDHFWQNARSAAHYRSQEQLQQQQQQQQWQLQHLQQQQQLLQQQQLQQQHYSQKQRQEALERQYLDIFCKLDGRIVRFLLSLVVKMSLAENFNAEAIALMILTYITLITIILRIAFALCQFAVKNEIDQDRKMRERSLTLEKVIIRNVNENKQNSKFKYYEKPTKSDNSSSYEKQQTVLLNSSTEDKKIHPVAKNVHLSTTQSYQKQTSDDESFWLHSFEESELSKENSNVPQTSAYGMRKVGKKKYIDDTNIGSPGSKALEQKSSEHIEVEEGKCGVRDDNADEHADHNSTK